MTSPFGFRIGNRGAVFIDVLTSMAFVLVLIGLAQTWARAVLYNQKALEAVATANQEAALAIEALAGDVRDAGFDSGSGVLPIMAAGREILEVSADLNGDGDLQDAHEQVRYGYRGDRRQVTRASGRGSPQPFIDDVPPGGLRFSFWDESAAEISSAPSGISAVDLPRIRRIDVRLQIDLRNPDPRAPAPIRAEVSTTIALRNR